jgi:formylglycine-generating enzyme required for sulfatase activity
MIDEQEFEFQVVTVDELGAITQRQTQRAKRFSDALPDGVSLEMVAVPAGSYLMGSRPSDGYPDEHPQHSVTIKPFWMSRYPVTQAQWQAIMDWAPPYRSKGVTHPVDRVSWYDAWEFCQQLVKMTGRDYRLPSEAEWEYACRAGTRTPFCFGETLTTDLANYVGEHVYRSEPKGTYRHESIQAGALPPNGFGLHEMHGNVWEWCADAWHDDYVGAPSDGSPWESKTDWPRVLRGGCWHDPPGLCRSAARLKQMPDEAEDFFGFRIALSSLEQTPDRVKHVSRSYARSNENLSGRILRQFRRWQQRRRYNVDN